MQAAGCALAEKSGRPVCHPLEAGVQTGAQSDSFKQAGRKRRNASSAFSRQELRAGQQQRQTPGPQAGMPSKFQRVLPCFPGLHMLIYGELWRRLKFDHACENCREGHWRRSLGTPSPQIGSPAQLLVRGPSTAAGEVILDPRLAICVCVCVPSVCLFPCPCPCPCLCPIVFVSVSVCMRLA